MDKEGRKRERKWRIILSQNPRKDKSSNKMKSVIKDAKASREASHHSSEQREMSRNFLEMGITVFLKT